MPDSSREPQGPLPIPFPTSDAIGTRGGGVSRRTLIGAAWSVPVIVAAVAAPLAAASGETEPNANFSWSEAEAIQGQSSVLTLMLPNGSLGIGSTATIVFTVVGYGSIPSTISSGSWTYTPNFGANTAVLTSPVGGVTGGTRGFTIEEWAELSGPYTIAATYSNDREPGSLTATITVGFGPEPTAEWLTDPVPFGGTSTLRVTIPEDSYVIGKRGIVADTNQFPPPNQTPPFPAGTTTVLPAGWTTVTDPQSGMTSFEMASLAEGVYDFVYTIGAGTTAVTPGVLVFGSAGVPLDVPLHIVPA